MSNIYALCKFCEVENEFIPLEVRPYSDDFQAGAASRDAEVAELKVWNSELVKHQDNLADMCEKLRDQVTLLRDVLKTIYEDFDCDKNAHDYGTDCRCCIAEQVLAATELPK